jgi:hypothetical protein
MNLILMQFELPPVIVKQDKEERNQYYYCLSLADSGEIIPLLDFMATCLNRSIELYIKAAEGENIDEFDDFEKELQLFKREFEGDKNKVEIRREAVVQRKIFVEFLWPLVNQLVINHRKLKEFFFELNAIIDDPYSSEFAFEPLTEESVFKFCENTEFSPLIMGLELKGFKSEINSFLAFTELNILFNKFRYEIRTRRYGFRLGSIHSYHYLFPPYELIFSDYYNKMPSKNEITLLSNSISKSTLDYVKKRDRIKTSSFPFDSVKVNEEWNAYVSGKSATLAKVYLTIDDYVILFQLPTRVNETELHNSATDFLSILYAKYDLHLTGIGYRVAGSDVLTF